MKHTLTLLCLLASICLTYAQGFSLTQEEESPTVFNQISHALDPLDLSQVETKLLYEKSAFPMMGELYDGGHLTPNNHVNFMTFGLLYGHVSSMQTSPFLPLPNEAYNDVSQAYNDGEPVPFLVQLYDYEQISPSAIDEELIFEEDEQLFDVEGRDGSPYIKKTVFAATPIRSNFDDGQLSFILEANNLLTNLNDQIEYFEIDLGGDVWQINLGEPFSTSLDPGMDHSFVLTAYLNDDRQLKTHGIIHVKDNNQSFTNAPDINENITVGGQGARVRGFSNCEDGLIRKPFIYVEGFEPNLPDELEDLLESFGDPFCEDCGWRRIRQSLIGAFNVQEGDIIWNILDDEGYDIITVDFFDGGANLFENSLVLQEVIQWVNTQKITEEPNVLMGESMGALLSQHALLSMEEGGMDHETEVLLTFDGPLQGANIPMALQGLVLDISTMKIVDALSGFDGEIGDYAIALKQLREVLNVPAARQMLLLHIEDPQRTDFNEFYDDKNGMGPLENCKHVALINGSVVGTQQEVQPGERIIYFDLTAGDVLNQVDWTIIDGESLVSSIANSLTITLLSMRLPSVLLDMRALPENGQNSALIYKRRIHNSILNIIPIFSRRVYRISGDDVRAYDSAPGGTADGDLPPVLNDVIVGSGGVVLDPFRFGFIPTFSSLDINSPQMFDFTADYSNVNEVVASQNTTQDAYTGVTGGTPENQQHLDFRNGQTSILVSELIERRPTNIWTGEFNYGRSDEIPAINQVLVNSTSDAIDYYLRVQGSIGINQPGVIGDINLPNAPAINDDEFFELTVRPGCVFRTTVTIENGGLIEVGNEINPNKKGRLILENNSTIDVLAGGTLKLQDGGSQIVVGGTVGSGLEAIVRIRKDGILEIGDNSDMLIQQNGKIILDDGAIVKLQGTDAEMRILGEMIYDKSIDFSGGGHFQFDGGSELSIVNGFYFNGSGMDATAWKINTNLITQMNNKLVDVKNTKIEYLPSNSGVWEFHGPYRTTFKNTAVKGFDNDEHTLRIQYTKKTVVFRNCEFRGANFHLHSNGTSYPASSFSTRIISTDFFDQNVLLYSTAKSYFSGCQFKTVDSNPLAPTSDDEFGILYAEDIEEMVLVTNSKLDRYRINGVGAKLIRLSNSKVLNNLDYALNEAWYGVKLEDQSNLVLDRGARIYDNNIGVDVNTNNHPYAGLVLVDCGDIDFNHIGIQGNNVLLDIDAYVHAPSSTILNQNHFGSQTEFFAQYCELSNGIIPIDRSVPASGNYWNAWFPTNTDIFPYYYDITYSADNECFNGDDIDFELLHAPYVSDPRTACDYPIHPPTVYTSDVALCDECNVELNGEIVSRYRRGLYYLRKNQLGLAREEFWYAASYDDEYRHTANSYERTMIDVARIFVESSGDDSAPERHAAIQPAIQTDFILSNPVVNALTLKDEYANKLNKELSILSFDGKLIFSTRMNKSEMIVSSLSPGLYIAQLQYHDENENVVRQVQKFVVQ